MNFRRFLILAALAGSCIARAQTLNTPKLDSLFNTLLAKDRSMSSVAIAKGNKILYSRAIGFSNDAKSKSTVQTPYRIGSISKMFTACLIFQLIEANKLKLTTTLAEYYPQIPNAGQITIGQMLGHRSGIANITDDERYMTFSRTEKTHQQIVDFIRAIPPAFSPDSTTSYSNSNFILLGYIAETIYKKPYQQLLKEHITDKAGLKHTFYATTQDHAETSSYNYSNNKWERVPATDMSIPGGAGAILSTPTDLAVFFEALFAGKLVNKASLAQMMTIKDGYGMGMFAFPFGTEKFYGHNGGIDGFTSSAARNTKDSLTIAYCSNGARFTTNEMMIALLSICYNVPYKIPSFTSVTIKAEELDKYPGVYASSQMPLKITITKTSDELYAQATGQSAFPLTAKGNDKFEFEAAGIVLVFNPSAKEMTLMQGGATYLFKLEK